MGAGSLAKQAGVPTNGAILSGGMTGVLTFLAGIAYDSHVTDTMEDMIDAKDRKEELETGLQVLQTAKEHNDNNYKPPRINRGIGGL